MRISWSVIRNFGGVNDCLVLVTCGVLIWFIDRPIALHVPDVANAPLFALARRLSDIGDPIILIAATTVAYAAFRFGDRGRLTANRVLFVLVSSAGASVCTMILKVVFGRSRPELFLQDREYVFRFLHSESGFDSFPSEHAAVAAALAAALSLLVPAYRQTFVLLMFLLAAGRVLLGVHYVSDVLSGIFIGLAAVRVTGVLFVQNGMPLKPPQESGTGNEAT